MKAGMERACVVSLIVIFAVLGCAGAVAAQYGEADLENEFRDAKKIDLRTSTISCIVALRDVVGIPPPAEAALVKTFYPNKLSPVMQSVFTKPEIRGMTIGGRFVAILNCDYDKEYQDVLKHELVHAYITMASPQPLPFWFQEGSAVHFSTDKAKKFYGRPSKTLGVMEGRTVEVSKVYQQKLQNFHFLIEYVGKKEFYEWYRQAVETGDVDARPLLGLKPVAKAEPPTFRRPVLLWIGIAFGGAVIAVAVIGFYVTRRDDPYI